MSRYHFYECLKNITVYSSTSAYKNKKIILCLFGKNVKLTKQKNFSVKYGPPLEVGYYSLQ